MVKRKAYFKIQEALKNRRIPILIGLRRVGKTTILNQIKEENPNSTIITCDDVFIRQFKDVEFVDYIDSLIQNKKTLIMLDEIQVRKNWDIIVKNLFDRYNKKGIDFVVTGSSSLSFESKDTGVTRTEKVLIHTLDFSEYLDLTKKPKNFETFEHYLSFGAFPEFVNKEITIDEMLRLTIQPFLNDDIPANYNIKIDRLISLLFELVSLTNGEFNKSKSSKNTGIKIDQIDNYLTILERTHIIKKIFQINEDGSFGKYRKFKVYINPHFHIWLLRTEFTKLNPKIKGHIIESYWLYWATQLNGYYKEFFYLKNKDNEEIDFVSTTPLEKGFKTLHEFKYTNKIDSQKLYLLKKTPAKNKLVWCKENKQEDGIKYISILDVDNN